MTTAAKPRIGILGAGQLALMHNSGYWTIGRSETSQFEKASFIVHEKYGS
jgi:phosphoribosylaminoimidazole carboxylase (NCAIR synthetase)